MHAGISMKPTNHLPRRAALCAAGAMLAMSFIAAADDFQGSTHKVPYDEEIIDYSNKKADGPIEKLQAKIDRGEAKLKYDEKFGWLPALLDALDVPKSSQMLVFSKTSLQRAFITPQNPRSLFYNDDVYLGFIPGAPVMEVSAVDPKLGGVFYTFAQEESEKPRFIRANDCTSCHGAAKTLGVPGHFVRSIATDETGEMDSQSEISYINHRSPLADRWAGWFVTGQSGSQAHRGNLIGAKEFARFEKEPGFRGNLTDLGRFFDEEKYFGRGSDLVALMVLEHQGQMHNYIARLNFETQIMMKTYGHIRYLRTQVAAFLRYLLLTEEQPLTAPVSGNPQFVKDFEAHGPRDAQGRSLRDLDLQTRLFKHPCSYLIYSDAFDALPAIMRDHLLQRLHDILTGKDTSEDFAAMRAEDRKNILEILVATKPSLPDYWRNPAPVSAAGAPSGN
ncbi:MAG: hypothetical protein HY301_05865 [Verrucomicrobia bacterium]|nr:hypothetical protein [Verrucomicrobiota bacterium]